MPLEPNAANVKFEMFFLRYAFRNLKRNRRRTALTIVTILFSVAVGIIANRYSEAVLTLWQQGAADTGTAHAQQHAAGYWDNQDGLSLDLTLQEGNAFEAQVRLDPNVLASVRRLELEGIVSTGEESIYFIGKGVEPDNEKLVSPRLFTHNDIGEFVSDEDKSGVVVGRGLAESLKIRVGDDITLISQTVRGSVNGIDAKVVGIVDAAIPSFSKRVIYTHVELLQRLVRIPGRYTELGIRLKEGVDVDTWVAANQGASLANESELRGWWQIEPVIRKVGRIWNSVVILITCLLLLSTALSVLNIIFMLVSERTVEIGTLVAIGARSRDVKILFALEAILMGFFGVLCGALLGNGIVYLMHVIGVPFTSPFGSGQLLVHPTVHWGVTAIIGTVAICICSVAAIIPARKAALVEPVRAFRGQLH